MTDTDMANRVLALKRPNAKPPHVSLNLFNPFSDCMYSLYPKISDPLNDFLVVRVVFRIQEKNN